MCWGGTTINRGVIINGRRKQRTNQSVYDECRWWAYDEDLYARFY